MMKEHMKYIGKTCKYFITGKSCFIYFTIDDIRNSFGRIEYKITPQNGGGYTWVNEASVTIVDLYTV